VGAEAEYQRVRQIYNTSGEVFGRLCDRFPNHKMAGQTKTLSGQAFLQAQDYEKAVAAFEVVRDKFKNDKDLMSEASYWCGDCHLRLNKPDMAYLVWKKLTWDYPDTKWAKYARGRLTEKVMVEVASGAEK
jgi:TolA-binding protein